MRAYVRVYGALRPLIPFHFDCVARGARNRTGSDDLSNIVLCRGLVDRNRCVMTPLDPEPLEALIQPQQRWEFSQYIVCT